MEKVIEKLEKRVTLIADNLEFTLKELEERVTDKEKTLAEIEGHRTYIKQLKEALATTEKNGGATHEYLLQELECVRRNRERIEGVVLPNIEKDIETLREDVKNLRGKLEDARYTLAYFKGETLMAIPPKVWKETACCGGWVKPVETVEDAVNEVSKAFEAIGTISEETSKAVGDIVPGGSLPICEVKVDMDDMLKILKESFPTIEDFLKWLYGDKAVKEYQCPHNRTQQMAVVDGTITFCTDCRKELVEPTE